MGAEELLAESCEGAAQEIGRLINTIMELAPSAGLYVEIKVSPARAAIIKENE